MRISRDRYIAVWVKCPKCGRAWGLLRLPPSKKWRAWTGGTCDACNVPNVLVKRRYYTVYAADFYGQAGTCKETCQYYYRHPRELRRAIAEAQRRALAYQEAERRRAAARKLVEEAQKVARSVLDAGILDAEAVARAAWEQSGSREDDGDPFFS